MTRSVGVVVTLTLAFLSAGCSRGDGPEPTASPVPSAASPSTSSVPPTTALAPGADPFAIPDVIDAAYVNRVLAALYAIDGDITREVLAIRSVQADVIRRIGDIYADPQLTRELETLPSLLEGDPARFKEPPGNRRAVVMSVVTARADCIVALVESDFSEVVHVPTPIDPMTVVVVALVPAAERVLKRDVNPTPWAIINAERIVRSEPSEEFSSCA